MSIAFIFTLPARTKQASSLRTLPASVVCSSVPAKPEAFLAEVTLRFTSAKNRCGLRADRLRPPSCPPLYPDTAPSSRCRARCLNLRSQTISAFPFRCLFPTPPASLRRRAHSITIRSATSACFSDSSMPVCYFPNSEAHGRHIHDTFLPPIEEQPTAFQLTASFHQ